jgi:hypothetical protein
MARKKARVWVSSGWSVRKRAGKCNWQSIGEAVEELENELNIMRNRVTRGPGRLGVNGKDFGLLGKKQFVQGSLLVNENVIG